MLNPACGREVIAGPDSFIETEAGREGHAVYGPYQRLEPGRYVAVFTIELIQPNPRLDGRQCAAVDVVTDYGRLIHAWRPIMVSDLHGGRTAIALTFDVREPSEFEYRVQVFGEVALRIAERRDIFPLSLPPGPPPAAKAFPSLASGPLPAPFVLAASGFRALYERGADFAFDGSTVVAMANGVRADVSDGHVARAANALWPHGLGIDISYADAREDVIMLQALRDVSRDDGFYIDVGANDPEDISVTKLFYDRGWRGINIDPSPKWHARLVAARPRDVNLLTAISDISGEVTFFDHEGGGLGTIEQQFADRHRTDHGAAMQAITVKTMTLTETCERFAPRDIHFLKIDVEGHEAGVLRSMDFQRFRPWLLCIEATEPMDVGKKTFQQWDGLVTDAGYTLARSDFLNRYYVADERNYLLARFASEPTGYISVKHG